ncbi:MAG: DUF3990 domain-containing protein [Bacteroidales bacterium]|nr:DUF3990 domain-containing protein [Bacteroidales bacterium]
MILHHGTYINFDNIDLSKSNKGKDFGKGFYLTEDYDQAFKLATFKAIQFGTEPIVISYNFDHNFLIDGSLSFISYDTYSKEWADFILQNRLNESDDNIHHYDVIYGPIANDKIGVQIRNLLENNIDFETFQERLKFIKGITFQYFFGTEKAISNLIRI